MKNNNIQMLIVTRSFKTAKGGMIMVSTVVVVVVAVVAYCADLLGIISFLSGEINSATKRKVAFACSILISILMVGISYNIIPYNRYVSGEQEISPSEIKEGETVTAKETSTEVDTIKENITEIKSEKGEGTTEAEIHNYNESVNNEGWRVLYNSYPSMTTLATYSGDRWNQFLYSQFEDRNGYRVRIYYYRVYQKI